MFVSKLHFKIHILFCADMNLKMTVFCFISKLVYAKKLHDVLLKTQLELLSKPFEY